MSKDASLSTEDLATYAHELRGALTVIAGYTEMLRRPLADAEKTAALDGIERAIARADTLCADALAGRTPSTATTAATFTIVSLSLLAEQVSDDERSATGRAIEMSVEGAPEVLGDSNALARVIGNLIDNAAKYSLSGAPIDVRVAKEEYGARSLAVIEVADRGPGIPDDEIERVLEPFVRLDRDAGRPGTGLGLAVASGVAVSHGGRLLILARDGGGTIVRLELPSAKRDGR